LSLKGPIDVPDLPGDVVRGSAREASATSAGDLTRLPYDEARAEFEKNYLLQVLEKHGGNISQAASAIRIHRQTLQYKLKQLGIRKSWSE
jgi:DNA-binding NtrC family response regulator